MKSTHYTEPATLEEALETLEDLDLQITSLNGRIVKLEEEKTEKEVAWKEVGDRLTIEQERSSKLIDPATYRKGWVEPEKYKKSKEKITKLETELKNLQKLYEAEKNKQPTAAPVDNSAIQTELTDWKEAFEGMNPQEAKTYWDLDGQRITELISYYPETNARLVKEVSDLKLMHNKLALDLARANLDVKDWKTEVAKYKTKIEIPPKS